MLSFESDYIEGAHPKSLARLAETNLEQLTGYGEDIYSQQAKEKIREACACPQAQICFLMGGTQTNKIVTATMLAPYEGVIAAETGHINTHEAGAIEAAGHKVLTLPQHQGKIDAKELAHLLEQFFLDENHEHMVFPGMVYISHPTEYGTLYSREELFALSALCGKYQIPLYMDGARLGYALAAGGDVPSLPEIAAACDAFYIGGTKAGALCGEALVFSKNNMPAHFMTRIKQHGALLAKGRLLGLQFDTLFTDGLYMEICRHADAMAARLKDAFREKGYAFFLETPTNQQFILLENDCYEMLKTKVAFGFWERTDDHHVVIRAATSWATTREDLEALRRIL